MLFFELLQIAIGNRSQLSHTPTAEEWRELYTLAQKQAMVGIAFRGVELLPVEQRPPRKLWMQWYMVTERIKALNAEMDRRVFKVARMFRREGFPGVVLKGQGMAQLYKVERSTVNGQQSTDGPHPNPLQGERGLGNPDEGFDLTLKRSSLAEGKSKSQNNCQGQGQQTTVNGQRTDHPDETLLMDHELHGLHENSGASATISHTESTESTENFCQRDEHANIDTITHTQACAGQDSQRLNDNVNDNHDGIYTTSPLQEEIPLVLLYADKPAVVATDAFIPRRPPNLGGEINCPDGTVDRRPSTVDHRLIALRSISCYRTPGDIDIWLHGERDEILEYVRRHVPDCKPVYHHVDFPVVDDVSIEVHFTPTWMNSPIRNRRLQRFFHSFNFQFSNFNSSELPVPNAAFNRVYILVHIYRHLFAEGIGLRQLLDYYFVLQQGFTELEREETLRMLRSLGMMRFTRAVMWVLQEVYGLPDRYLLTSPDAKEGRFLLDEIMLAGNFGKYDERMQRAAGEGTFRWGLRKVLRNFRFVRSYPSEVLWSPIFKVWHLFWRIRHS